MISCDPVMLDQCNLGAARADVNKMLPGSACTTLHMACRKGHQSAWNVWDLTG